MRKTRLLPLVLFGLLAATAACSEHPPTAASTPHSQANQPVSKVFDTPMGMRIQQARGSIRNTYPRPTAPPSSTPSPTGRRYGSYFFPYYYDAYTYYYPDYGLYQYAGYSDVQVVIRNYRFFPTNVRVPAGGRVTWVNQDPVTHTSTSPLPGVVTSSGAWDGMIQPGGSFTYVFNVPGTFGYYCRIHPSMRGAVTVDP